MKTTNSPIDRITDSLSAARPDINATVSASAGTGKTWLLVTRIIRLLLVDTEPGSILALTFTRKAAAEMQMRLQERLYQMATADDQTLNGLLTQAGCTLSRSNIDKSRELYEKLLHANYPVRLQTFHSFCQDILSHFPLEADITPGFELIESTALLQQQAWEELFAEATRNPQSELANDLDSLMQACGGPSNTRTALNNMLAHRSDWWAYTEGRQDAAAFASAQLHQQLQIDTEADPYDQFFSSATLDQLVSFNDLLRMHPIKTNLKFSEQLEQALSSTIANEDRFKRLQPVFLTNQLTPRSRKPSKSQAANMGDAGEDRYLELHQHICASILDTLEIARRIQTLALNAVWYRTGQRYIGLYQQLKRELRVLDFTDLEWSCYRLMNTADNAHWVQYKIDQRIDHVLIDEFQDTNPTQWQLITPLLEEIASGPDERRRSFFLVGDEKQSIYSFRRANPELQKQASDYLARSVAALDVRLDSSRRSSPAIMDVVNAVFCQDAIGHYMPEFSQHSTHLDQLPGRASLFALQQLDSDDEGVAEEEPERELRNPLLEPRSDDTRSARHHEADLIADQILNLISDKTLITAKNEADSEYIRPLQYGDIMILMRNRTHIGVYESALRDRGIPFIGSQRGSLLDNQEIQDLEKLLDSLITPYNNLSIAQVLKSPIFAASDEDLMRIALMHKRGAWFQRLIELDDDPDISQPLRRAAKLLARWHSQADTMPVHDLLDRIFAEGNVISRYIASAPQAQRQRVSANLQRFHELSLELDSGRYPSLSHFLHYLRSIRQHRDGRPDEPAVSHTQSSVNLMTIHASKGLEAPVVILADCDNQGKHHNAYSALVDWPANSRRPVKFQLITGRQNIDNTTLEVLRHKQEAQKREELNLLYVALTRARQHLLITGSVCRDKSGWFEYLRKAMESLASPDKHRGWHHYRGEYTRIGTISTAKSRAVTTAVDARLKRPIAGLASPEHLIAPSLSLHDDTAVPISPQDGEGARRGIAIHRALDLMSRTPAMTAEQALRQIRQEAVLTADDELDECLDEAGRTIANEAFSDLFQPDRYDDAMNELPVLYQHNDQRIYGLIDRLIIAGDDIVLIDYKTHRVGDPVLVDQLAGTFNRQMQLYRRAVEKLWPGRNVKSGLLFTHSARLVWIEPGA